MRNASSGRDGGLSIFDLATSGISGGISPHVVVHHAVARHRYGTPGMGHTPIVHSVHSSVRCPPRSRGNRVRGRLTHADGP